MTEDKKALLKRNHSARKNPFNYPVGITSYENFFSNDELKDIEKHVEETEEKCKDRAYLPMTAQQTFCRKGVDSKKINRKLVRTKFFFGYRYMWTKEQLSEPFSHVAAGVRCDVS